MTASGAVDGSNIVLVSQLSSNNIVKSNSTYTTFAAKTSGTTEQLFDVAVTGSVFLTIGNNGVARFSSDGGETWATTTTGVSTQLNNIVVSPFEAGAYMVGGNTGTLLKATISDGDQFVVPDDNPTNGWIRAIA